MATILEFIAVADIFSKLWLMGFMFFSAFCVSAVIQSISSGIGAIVIAKNTTVTKKED